MLDLNTAKKLSLGDLDQYLELFSEEARLTERRLAALRRRQARDPNWAAYDPFVDEVVDIGIRIEEQTAVRDELGIQLDIISKAKDHKRGLNQTIRML